MKLSSNKIIGMLAAAFLFSVSLTASAQAVIFPQEQQPGKAQSLQEGSAYKLSNNLFSATFVHKDGRLIFGGSPELGLQAGTEPFKIQIDEGTEVLASQMTLKKVRLVNLEADVKAAKASLRVPGMAVEAEYTYKALTITWRAVLRDNSHYLRTELSLSAGADTRMHAVYPMLYNVDNSGNKRSPAVTGNTRGAIITSDKIFAGVETPTAFNTVLTMTNDVTDFKSQSWTSSDFHSVPSHLIPEQVLAGGTYDNPGVRLADTDIVSKHGYLSFYETGENQITFQYTRGDHRLNIVGVDVHDLQGRLVTSDYHAGFTGGEKDRNMYTLNIPAKGNYEVRYYVETKTETIMSEGSISYNKRVAQPEVRFDGQMPDHKNEQANTRSLSKNSIDAGEEITDSWTPGSWKTMSQIPPRIAEMGFAADEVRMIDQPLSIASEGELRMEFVYYSGYNGLNIIGTVLIDSDGNEVASDLHKGFSGYDKRHNVYTIKVPYAGSFTLRYYAETKTEPLTSSGNINIGLLIDNIVHLPAQTMTPIEGKWSRRVVLEKGNTWNVSAVVGLMADGQERRSVACYVERERAVPWRAFPAYISWYELNIDRNNDRYYTTNMNVNQCTDVVEQWRKNLFEKYNTGIAAFVWDDGWDEYGTWTFNKNFPNGFSEPNEKAVAMNSGIGAWLGPVGGYGKSGDYRREYWQNRGEMQLSNPAYYKVFYDACSRLIHDYEFRFFKFDGISDLFSATGPKDEAKGDENAEAIIHAEQDMRRIKPDIFFNTTVGTWASPFWFNITDAVWRQEADYSEIGNNNIDRERWITYRDHLVYQNFVDRSPMCPINCLMTHGFILTKFGNVSKNMDYDAVVREMRCAFACGSGMVELYCDYDLMNNIANARGEKGALWADLAECIQWQKKNASVLPDTHWVGGNPWNGYSHEVYGWASWNGENAVLALRNGDNKAKTFETTLRKALEIPSYISGTITFNKAFAQADLSGFATDEPIDIDAKLTLSLPASSVFVFDTTKSYEEGKPAVACGYYRLKNYMAGTAGYADGYPSVERLSADAASGDVQISELRAGGINAGSVWKIEAQLGKTVKIKHANADRYISAAAENCVKLGDAAMMFYVEDWSSKGTYGFYCKDNGSDMFLTQGTDAYGNYMSARVRDAQLTAAQSLYAWKLEKVSSLDLSLNPIGEGYWASLCLPFAVTVPADCAAYAGNIKAGCLVLKKIGSVIPANTPVIVRGSADTYALNIAEETAPLTIHNDLSGCNLSAPANKEGKHYYTLGSGAQGIGAYPFMGEFLDANTAYLTTDALYSQGLKVIIDDSDTGIDAVEDSAEKCEYYDLGGRRAADVHAGIYISRGKKLIVR